MTTTTTTTGTYCHYLTVGQIREQLRGLVGCLLDPEGMAAYCPTVINWGEQRTREQIQWLLAQLTFTQRVSILPWLNRQMRGLQ